MRFRKKPVVIEAMHFDGSSECAYAVLTWAGAASGIEHRYTSLIGNRNILVVQTLEGEMRALSGDWIIKGIKGEFYPCKPDIFEATYEAVDEPRAANRGDEVKSE